MSYLSVLVLDDDEFMLEVLHSMLLAIGVNDVQTFSSAEAALSDVDVTDLY